jgi:hypothetical protein
VTPCFPTKIPAEVGVIGVQLCVVFDGVRGQLDISGEVSIDRGDSGRPIDAMRHQLDRTLAAQAPVAQPAEAADLKSAQCGFDPHRGHVFDLGICALRS